MAQLYSYDVRGIQDYIFRTNKVKEIIGASTIVEDKIIKVFTDAIESYNKSTSKKLKLQKDYEKLTLDFFNSDYDIEIFNYGGGILNVLYKDGTVAKEITKMMRKLLVEQTYTLQLAAAHVDVTGEGQYKTDYNKLRDEMNRVKAEMPMVMPVSSFPVTMNDPVTGFAFSKKDSTGKNVTYETQKKLEAYRNSKKQKFDLEFAREEGNSLVAVVHIDGNNMGKDIQTLMKDVTDYKEAAKKMRTISNTISDAFDEKALGSVEDYLEDKYTDKNKIPFRTIIHAGDDITFICKAEIAMDCVKLFMNGLADHSNYKACAGMYITHVGFPFSRAYEYAEQLCATAKKPSRKEDGFYVDFQLNTGGILNDIEYIRNKYFKNSMDEMMCARPYRLNDLTGSNTVKTIELLEDYIIKIHKYPRSKIKNLRDAYYSGNEQVKKEIQMIDSRIEKEENKLQNMIDDYAVLFDAIDVMDLKWGVDNEKTGED